MDLEKKTDQLTKLSQRVKGQEPPAITLHQKQAAIAMAEIEKSIHDLIMEKMPIKVIFASLFYFWFTLEAPLRNLSEQQIDQALRSLDKTMEKIIWVIQSVVDTLPDHEPTMDMKKLGETVNDLKSYLSDRLLDHPLLQDDILRCTTNVNTRIHTVSSNLLKQSFHPEIIGNVLFSKWLRLSTLHAYISEEYYQEFYFVEIMSEVRKQVPIPTSDHFAGFMS